jgi:integrase
MIEPILKVIGARKLRDLSAADVRQAPSKMAAEYFSSAVTMGYLALKRAIRHAEANDLVSRNVAILVDTPKGQEGRPSKSLTLEQAVAVIAAAKTLPAMELHPGLKDVRQPAVLMHAYIVLSLLAGLCTEEARALCWRHVSLGRDPHAKHPIPPHVAVWRSVRLHGETKAERSRRTLALPQLPTEALRALRESREEERLRADEKWQDIGWCSRDPMAGQEGLPSPKHLWRRISRRMFNRNPSEHICPGSCQSMAAQTAREQLVSRPRFVLGALKAPVRVGLRSQGR